MSDVILTTDNLKSIFDSCISDLDNNGTTLYNLAHLMHVIGMASDNTDCHSVVAALGGFTSEIISSRPFCQFPILAEEVRAEYQRKFTEAIADGKRALTSMSEYFCNSSSRNSGNLVEAIGLLGRHSVELNTRRTALLGGTRPDNPE